MNDELMDSMPLAKRLGIRLLQAERERVVGELTVAADCCTLGKTLHGGALITLADSLGAIAAFLNLPEGAKGTTTIESKTNFLRPAPLGSTVRGETTAISVGRRLSVWSTTISGSDGKSVAVVTQTQLVL